MVQMCQKMLFSGSDIQGDSWRPLAHIQLAVALAEPLFLPTLSFQPTTPNTGFTAYQHNVKEHFKELIYVKESNS